MKNEEWEKLKEAYDKESSRRLRIKLKKEAAEELKKTIKYIIAHKDTIKEIDIYVPGSEWQHEKQNFVLKDSWQLVKLFIDCLETFIPTLDKCISIDIENEEEE